VRPIYLISLTPYPGVIHIPSVTINFLHPVIDFSNYDGIIVTSKQSLKALEYAAPKLDTKICLSVGEETSKIAKSFGFKEIWTAEGDGLSILELLKQTNPKIRWIYLRPTKVATQWAEKARMQGFLVDEAVVYESVCTMEEIDIDPEGVLIFTSPSAIECFMKHSSILSTQKIVVIGETTKKALPIDVESVVSYRPSIEACVETAKRIAQQS